MPAVDGAVVVTVSVAEAGAPADRDKLGGFTPHAGRPVALPFPWNETVQLSDTNPEKLLAAVIETLADTDPPAETVVDVVGAIDAPTGEMVRVADEDVLAWYAPSPEYTAVRE